MLQLTGTSQLPSLAFVWICEQRLQALDNLGCARLKIAITAIFGDIPQETDGPTLFVRTQRVQKSKSRIENLLIKRKWRPM
jgi:hypothetical protein